MINEKIIKHKVASLLMQYRLQCVTLDNLVYIIEDQGYEIVEFALDDLGTQHLLNQMGLADYAKERKAFTYKQRLLYLVIVDKILNNRSFGSFFRLCKAFFIASYQLEQCFLGNDADIVIVI